jgi:hypothetical protein
MLCTSVPHWCIGLELYAIKGALHAELVFLLKHVFRQNGYNDRQIHRVLNRQPNIGQHEDKTFSVAFLPY